MSQIPSALLFIASGCQHCPAMLKNLSELVEQGKIASLEIVNISVSPARAEQLNIRTVPWLKLEDIELTGLKSQPELLDWINRANTIEGQSAYFEELITSGRISKVQQIVEKKPGLMPALFSIMANKDSSLSARIGVSAVIEQLAGSAQLIENIDILAQYCQHKTARVRNDAGYYLGLSRHLSAEEHLQALLEDENDEVREVAREALQDITEHTNDALQRDGVFNITI